MSISVGNGKMGKVPNISLTPVRSCKNCAACAVDCYAMKSYRQYKGTRASWDSNYAMAKTTPAKFFQMIGDYLTKHTPRYFRYHVAGDILNQRYLNRMNKLAREHTGTTFLAFTKRYDLDYSNRPDNMSIVFSAWPNSPMPKTDLPVAYMQDGTETRVPNNALECPGDCEHCGMCFDLEKLNRSVVFHKH